MVFTVLAACDLSGKCNFELTFPTVPTISELRERINDVMSQEAALRRSPQAGQFTIHRAQVFDERMEMWVDLVASSQLEDYCQVYVFQKESPWHKDTPGRIPHPVKPVSASPSLYRRSASPPPFGEHHAPLYSDLREGSPYSTGRSPYRGGPDDYSPARSSHNEGLDSASHAEKVKMVYDEMDVRNSRAVTLDEWTDAFAKLHVTGADALTDATVEDLFTKKADRNEDSVVSYPEFQHFAEMYPKLLDCLYFRFRRHHQDMLRKDRLKSQYDQLEDLERRLDDAREQALEAETEGINNQQRIDECEAAVQQAKEEEQDAAQAKNHAHEDSENARRAVREAKQDEAAAKDDVKKRDTAKRQAQRVVENQEKKVQVQQAELQKLEKELEVLRRKVEDKEAEIMRQQENVSNAQRDAEDARGKALDCEDPALDEQVKERGAATGGAEDGLKHCIQAENEKTSAHRNAQRAVSQAAQAKAQAEKDAQATKIKEDQRKKLEARAEKAVEDQKRAIERNEAKEVEADEKRQGQEEKENELIVMEVRLREQREAVERKEEHLRGAHRDFSQEAGRSSPRGGFEA